MLTFAPGETKQTISVPIIDYAAVGSEQTSTVKLARPVNAALGTIYRTTYRITSDDADVLAPPQSTMAVNDFGGDGTGDIRCYCPDKGHWDVLESTEGFRQPPYGIEGAMPLGGSLR